jgi:hypothetical protein
MKGADLHRWFWKKMAERIGKRWYEDMGLNPTDEWKQLLDQYTYAQIKMALEVTPPWEYPPTHPMIAKLFRETADRMARQGTEDLRRGVWRSNISADICGSGALVQLWPYGTKIEQIPPELLREIVPFANDLIDEMVKAEAQSGLNADMCGSVSTRTFQFLARLKERHDLVRYERALGRK